MRAEFPNELRETLKSWCHRREAGNLLMRIILLITLIVSWLATACNAEENTTAEVNIASAPTETARPSATATLTPAPTDTARPTITPSATSTSTPSPTATATPTATPTTSPEILRTKWRPPLVMSAFLFATCEGFRETAQKTQDGEIDGFEVLGEQLGAAIIVRAVDEGLVEWEARADQIGLRDRIQTHVYSLGNLLAQWSNDEIDSAKALRSTEELCQSTERTFERVVEEVVEDGLPVEDAEKIILEAAEALGEAIEEDGGSGSSGSD